MYSYVPAFLLFIFLRRSYAVFYHELCHELCHALAHTVEVCALSSLDDLVW